MGIFRKRSVGEARLPTTGHPGDDALLTQIAQRSDLDSPRHWVHYLYVKDEPLARSAAQVISAAGWHIQRVEIAANGGPEWVVIADMDAAITSPKAVREARQFFEGVAATHDGGEYDGWEASV